MSHLEDPAVDVKPIAPDAYRISVESRTSIHKFDLAEIDLLHLIQDGLEALLTHETEMGACSFCGPDGGLAAEETCDLLHLAPLGWRKPRRVFVNSMSDPFLEDFSNVEIAAMFGVMAACPQHTFQLLTKRSKRMREWFGWVAARPSGLLGQPYSPSAACGEIALKHWIGPPSPSPPWPLPNLWLGVSAEDQERANERIPDLLATPAEVKFVSYEPALGPVDFCNILADGADLGWIIVGGESGRGARPFDIGWARSVVRQCKAYGVPCFVKQMGDNAYERAVHGWSRLRRKDGKALVRKGGDPSEWPEDLRVREYPEESP